MTGNLALDPTDPVFLLDESLVPAVARSLQLVGYNFVDVAATFGTKGPQDPEQPPIMTSFSESEVEQLALDWLAGSAGVLPTAPTSHPEHLTPSATATTRSSSNNA